jgi:hypothetical protein
MMRMLKQCFRRFRFFPSSYVHTLEHPPPPPPSAPSSFLCTPSHFYSSALTVTQELIIVRRDIAQAAGWQSYAPPCP